MTDISITPANVVAGTGAVVVRGTANATIAAGQVVYKDSTTGQYGLADSNSATAGFRAAYGIALNGAAAGQPISVLKSGPVMIGGTLTAGTAYYLSDTAGGICPVADVGSGEYVSLLGVATSTSVLNVSIQNSGVAL